MSILRHIPTKMRRKAATNGGEYAGPCPFCDGGEDRFRVWPEHPTSETGRYWCRQCDRSGDGIQLVRELRGLGFREACERLHVDPGPKPERKSRAKQAAPKPRAAKRLRPPGETWRKRGRAFAEASVEALWSNEGARALDYLRGRGLTDDAITAASFGYNPCERWEPAERWGLSRKNDVYLPRGIVIPWVIDGELWRLNIRRPAGDPKYIGPAGWTNGLYWADRIRAGLPVVLVEGEFDAWTAMQEAHDIVTAAATGSTHGARHLRWETRLALASVVLVAFDSDEPGDEAARYWTGRLDNAIRWCPYWEDVNSMFCDGADVRAWLAAGIEQLAAA